MLNNGIKSNGKKPPRLMPGVMFIGEDFEYLNTPQ